VFEIVNIVFCAVFGYQNKRSLYGNLLQLRYGETPEEEQGRV